MSDLKCVVEGCDLEYDVVCSFSFYNVNSQESEDALRQEWVNGAMQEESECLWRHVSLQLCGYHFELDTQGLWIDSPMLPELLTPHERHVEPDRIPTEEEKKMAETVQLDHNYFNNPVKPKPEPVSRLNVRQLVDTLGFLSMKNLQRKQLWVARVEADKNEASITQSEQVITKMQGPRQLIEILPQSATITEPAVDMMHMIEGAPADNFIYEIAEEQEIAMDEVGEVPHEVHHEVDEVGQVEVEVAAAQEWTVNIVPEEQKPKYAFIKHTPNAKKKRHFTADISQLTVQGDYENYYILPDADPSVGVEISTTSPQYIVEDYQQLVMKREKKTPKRRKKTKLAPPPEVIRQSPDGEEWVIETAGFDQDDSEDYDPKSGKPRMRRKNKKYLGYDFVT